MWSGAVLVVGEQKAELRWSEKRVPACTRTNEQPSVVVADEPHMYIRVNGVVRGMLHPTGTCGCMCTHMS
eukprot:26095-Eustigmatos_ZCMA.PRE.1